MPMNMTWMLQGASKDESVVVTVPYYRPETVRVQVNGVTKEGKVGRPGHKKEVGIGSNTGTHFWYWTENKIQFALKGEDYVILTRIDSIQLTMRLDVTTAEFWDGNGVTNFIDRLAAVLLIPTYRIRVVDTNEGSTIVSVQIDPDESLSRSVASGSSDKSRAEELKDV